MKFSTEIFKYINGELFSTALDVPFSNEKFPPITRINKILELTKDKRVIHIGCADHLPLIEEKIKNKKWLHGLLTENAQKCIGVDINKEAIDYITKQLNFNNVYFLNILSEKLDLIDNFNWDYIVLGEIIEHVDNPVYFLTQIRERFSGKAVKLLITAPNIYNILTINDIKNNNENINTDHRYWFSPYTLTNIVHKSGFKNSELFFVEQVKLPLIKKIVKKLKKHLGIEMKLKANCFSNLIIEAKF